RRHVRRGVADAAGQPPLRWSGPGTSRLRRALEDPAPRLERRRGDAELLHPTAHTVARTDRSGRRRRQAAARRLGKPMFQLTSKVAVVTGGASGIGEAISVLFARQGARVAVLDVDEAAARRVADRIVAAGGKAD